MAKVQGGVIQPPHDRVSIGGRSCNLPTSPQSRHMREQAHSRPADGYTDRSPSFGFLRTWYMKYRAAGIRRIMTITKKQVMKVLGMKLCTPY